ncbi:MAG: carboxypeptidase regulatory-like domain-containing protein [Bryobacteraceae bacterium]
MFATVRFLLLAALAAVSIYAQSNGAVNGAVQDESGAFIPGADIQVTNQLTGLQFNATSDDAGRFLVQRLPVGEYKLTARRDGFRQFVTEQFRLDADQTRTIAITLALGNTTESVTVTGAVSQVDTVSGTIRQVVDERRITELPLNGRNPVQLVLLVPGAVQSNNNSLSQNNGISVNGARGTSTNYMLDGGDNNDPQEGGSAVTPNPDALEEFSVLTNNFSAEYGRNAGAIVNAVTKSGTNQFHGSAFEFLRNDALDSRSFFAISKGKLRRNQYGGSFGGPAIKNKAFFFGSYEGVKQRQGETFSSLVVPTEAERRGDFSASTQKPRDPNAANALFPNSLIPATRFDPAALKFMELLQIPLPNASGNRHIFNRPNNNDTGQYLGRGDYSLSANQRLTGRVFETSSTEFLTAGLPVLTSDVKFDTWNIGGQHTWTITPSLLGIGQYTWNQSIIDRGPLPVGSGAGVSYQDMGVKVNRGGTEALGKELIPQYRGQVNGYWNPNQDNLVRIDRGSHQATYAMTYNRGAHLLKWGGEYRTTKSDRVTANGVDPQFTFNGQISGNAFSDFLIGRPFSMTQGSVRINRIRSQTYNLYFQDDWKVHQHLSFNFGVRYEPMYPYYSADDELTAFRAGQQSTVYPSAPTGLLYAGDNGIPRGGTHNDLNNLAPRVGLAWSPFGSKKTSVRAAYGFFYDVMKFHTVSHFVNSPPYSLQITLNTPRSFSDPYAGQVNPFPYAPPATDAERARYTFLKPVTIGLSPNADQAAPYVQQWNLNIQRELARDYLLTVAYIGTKGTRLPLRNELNPALYRAGATAGNVPQRRIYTDFASIVDYQTVINSTYNALQITLNKRLSKGLSLLAAYTYSRSIDGSSLEVDAFNGQDPRNLRADKGLSDFDLRQRFISSFIYELPGPKTGLARAVLGGWQTNGILNIQSGGNFNVASGQDRALSGGGTQRPNLVGNPYLDTGRSRDELLNLYFNPAAFALPAIGEYGNSGRNTMIGPGRWNLDFALFKGFQLREHMKLHFRWEMFNAVNHANLGNPRSNISAANPGRIDSTSGGRVMQLGLRLVF